MMRVHFSEFSGVQVGDVNTSASGTSATPSVGPTGTQSFTDGLAWATFAYAGSAGTVDVTPANSHGIAFSGVYESPVMVNLDTVTPSPPVSGFELFSYDVGSLETLTASAGLSASTDWIATVVFFTAKTSAGIPEGPDAGRARIFSADDSRGQTQIYALGGPAQSADDVPQQLSGVPYAQEFQYYSDFIGSAVPAEFLGYSNNGGTQVLTAGVSSHPGLVRLTTGTTSNATGNAGLRLGELASAPIVLGSGPVRFGCLLKVPGATTTPFVHIRAGLQDTGAQADPTAGFAFRWDGNVNTNKWQVGKAGSYSDSGVTVSASAWYMLEIYVYADGTTADFYINGNFVAQKTGAAETAALIATVGVDKDTSTTTSRTVDVDLLYVRGRLTAVRY